MSKGNPLHESENGGLHTIACLLNFFQRAGARARCVVVLGLPYPNPADPELQERMRYMDSAPTALCPSASSAAASAGW